MSRIKYWMLIGAIASMTLATQLPQKSDFSEVADYRAILSSNAPTESEREFYRKLLARYQRETERLLREAADALKKGTPEEASKLLQLAAREISRIGAEGDSSIIVLREEAARMGRIYHRDPDSNEPYVLITPDQRRKIKQLETEVQDLGKRLENRVVSFPLDALLDRLWLLLKELQNPPLYPLHFLGTYTADGTVEQPAAGGHASAGGGGPPQLSSHEDIQQIDPEVLRSLDFEAVPIISEKTFCGGPTKDHILESGGSGVALLDYDNDGLLDIFLVNAFELTPDRKKIAHTSLLYRNLGNWKFENVTQQAGLTTAAWGNGVCVGDYNNDGYLDLLVTNFGPNFLFRNNGNGTFTEVAAKVGVEHPGWNTGCSFLDADGDGNLDLYLAGYVKCDWGEVFRAQRTLSWRGVAKVMLGPVGLPGARDVFFRNEGDKFTDWTEQSGLADEKGFYGFGVLATDYNQDGWVDLYVANDSNPNYLYSNLGHGRFKEVGLSSGVALGADGRAQAGMGVDSGDYDNDGLLDLVVTNFAQDTNTLYRNLGNGMFEDVSQASGLFARTFKRMGWGVAFFDADLDGTLDLFFANGHIYPQVDHYPALDESYRQKNQLLLNQHGYFRDVSEKVGSGLEVQESSRGLAVGDLDNDGNLDLVISNVDAPPTVIRNRSKTPNHWVSFKLMKSGQNRFCIGATVTVLASGRKQIREIRSGGSYLSQNDLRPHFGLGSYAGPVDVEVRLGAGRWKWKQLPTDRLILLTVTDERRIREQ